MLRGSRPISINTIRYPHLFYEVNTGKKKSNKSLGFSGMHTCTCVLISPSLQLIASNHWLRIHQDSWHRDYSNAVVSHPMLSDFTLYFVPRVHFFFCISSAALSKTNTFLKVRLLVSNLKQLRGHFSASTTKRRFETSRGPFMNQDGQPETLGELFTFKWRFIFPSCTSEGI